MPLTETWKLSTSIFKFRQVKQTKKLLLFVVYILAMFHIYKTSQKLFNKVTSQSGAKMSVCFAFFAGAPQYFYTLGCLMKDRRMNENSCPQNFWLIFTPCKVLCYRTPTIYTFFVSHYNFGQVYKLLFDKKQRWKLAVCTLNCQLLWEKWISKGKSLSEAFIFASTNPNYDKRLFIELQV